MKKSKCPLCKKWEGVPLILGFPNPEDFELESRGEAILGGCVLGDKEVDRECCNCGHQWDSVSLFADDNSNQSLEINTIDKKQKTRKLKAQNKKQINLTIQQLKPVQIDGQTINLKKDQSSKRKRISIFPTIGVFFILILIGFALVGAASCSDGWQSGSIGRSGACSRHGGINRWPQILIFTISAIIAWLFHTYRANKANSR